MLPRYAHSSLSTSYDNNLLTNENLINEQGTKTKEFAFQPENTIRCDIYCKLLAFVTPCLIILVLIGIVHWSLRMFRKKRCGIDYTCSTPSSDDINEKNKKRRGHKKEKNNIGYRERRESRQKQRRRRLNDNKNDRKIKKKKSKSKLKDNDECVVCCDNLKKKQKKKKNKDGCRETCSYRIEHDPINLIKNVSNDVVDDDDDDDEDELSESSIITTSSTLSESSDWTHNRPIRNFHPRNKLWPRAVRSAEEVRWMHEINKNNHLSVEKSNEISKPFYEEMDKHNTSTSPGHDRRKEFNMPDSSSIEAKEYVSQLLSARGVYRNFEEKVIIESKNDCSSTSEPPVSVVRFSLFGFFLQTNDGYRFILQAPIYLYWKWDGESFHRCTPIRMNANEYELYYNNCDEAYKEGKLSLKPKGFCINISFGS